MGVEKIIQKIKDDTEKRIKEVEEEFKKKYEEKKKEYQKKIDEEKKRIEKLVKEKEEREIRNILATAKIKQRLDILSFKQSLMDKVIRKNIEEFLSSDAYRDLLVKVVKEYGNEGKIVVGKKEKEILSSLGLNAEEDDNIRGIIVKKEKVSYNFTIDTALEILDEEIRYDVGRILFSD